MWYWILKIFTIIFIRCFYRLKVEGRENIPQKTNFIVIANHTSYLDALVLSICFPQKIYWIASRVLYKVWWLKLFLWLTEAFPAGGSSEMAFQLLSENKSVGLFPEGKCPRDGKLSRFRYGAAMLSVRTGRPIVPCAIKGTFEALPIYASSPRIFRSIEIKIGKPHYPVKALEEEIISDVALEEQTEALRNHVKEMLNIG
jgi:1-acyl-sn-glycerol-3-phosphate acyltransferase